ncbi:Roadblock/LAMTOR2 domain-containing protein [Frankia sp. AiPs1]|uniref:hypothetical protein n=1 Tax=Frankia sp. AiPa1 TaxID=573492 RepID=UPI00202B3682|nr:hypothetical protein [Frankia sp. AiPa1]MCL9760722.1 hypothetical protein [Frankia sp. AiPa1]
MDIETALKEAMRVDGAIGVSLVDGESGMMLGSGGGGREFDLEVASAGNTELVRAKIRTLDVLGIKEGIEDILITLDRQYHLIRLLDQAEGTLFLYLVLDRSRANLALARHSLRLVARALDL